MRPPYPIGTLCYIVRCDDEELVGRVVTVTGHGPRASHERKNCFLPCVCNSNETVAQIAFRNGTPACCRNWASLRPICPPVNGVMADEQELALLPFRAGTR